MSIYIYSHIYISVLAHVAEHWSPGPPRALRVSHSVETHERLCSRPGPRHTCRGRVCNTGAVDQNAARTNPKRNSGARAHASRTRTNAGQPSIHQSNRTSPTHMQTHKHTHTHTHTHTQTHTHTHTLTHTHTHSTIHLDPSHLKPPSNCTIPYSLGTQQNLLISALASVLVVWTPSCQQTS